LGTNCHQLKMKETNGNRHLTKSGFMYSKYKMIKPNTSLKLIRENMDKSKIKTTARKALIAADPNYYSWTPQQQEQFRATIDDAAQSMIEAVLLKNLRG